jgi:hypothetical protein
MINQYYFPRNLLVESPILKKGRSPYCWFIWLDPGTFFLLRFTDISCLSAENCFEHNFFYVLVDRQKNQHNSTN